jgi:hemolysin III
MATGPHEKLSVEEIANSLTHGVGLVLSVAGLIFLVTLAAFRGDGWHIASSVVYGASLVILYGASTCYHGTTSPELKRKLQIVDHCCIYLLIAGSYTPFALIALGGALGAGLLTFAWASAVLGIAMKVIFRGRFGVAGVISYVVMGWVGIIAVQPLYAALGAAPLALVVAGGMSYSIGVVFFGWHSIRHHHAIFHVFVLGGSILHFLAIAIYVMP